MMDPFAFFLREVEIEIRRGRAKFPGDRVTMVAFAEEFGEVAKALLDEPGAQVWQEAVQAATMAARIAIDGDSSVDGFRQERGLDDHRLGHPLLRTPS